MNSNPFSKPVRRTVANIRANVQVVKPLTGNKLVPPLIYPCKLPVPDRATQRFFTTQLPLVYSVMAMVSDSMLSPFIINLLLA